MKFSLLYGSHRDPRNGIRLARYLIKNIEGRGHEVEFFDAREINLPVLEKRYLDYEKGQAPEKLEKIAESHRNSDGFVIVAGEYNFSIQPGLKNLLDYFYQEYFFRPSALALYSISDFGGLRAASQLIQTMWALHMPAIPAFLNVPRIHKSMTEEGKPEDPKMDERTNLFLTQLEWYARALKAEREKGLPE